MSDTEEEGDELAEKMKSKIMEAVGDKELGKPDSRVGKEI